MKTADIIRRSFKNLKQAKGRTFLTSLAIAVGACTITLAMAAGAGGRLYVQQEVESRGLDGQRYINIYEPFPEQELSETSEVAEFIEDQEGGETDSPHNPAPTSGLIDQKMISQIESIDGVVEVNPSIYADALFVNLEGQEKKLVAPNLNIQTRQEKLVTTAGEIDTIPDKGVVITQDYARAFGFDTFDGAIGQTVHITLANEQEERQGFSFTISGVIEDSEETSRFYISNEDGLPLYDFQASQAQKNTFHSAAAIIDPDYESEVILQDIQQLGLEAVSQEQMEASFLEAVNIAQWGLVGFGALALLASIFGIINTQYISVLERTQQIGLMRAVGASRGDVGRLFRYEAAWIGFLGGSIGILVALTCKLAEPLVKNLLEMPDEFAILIFEPLTLLIILAILMLISMMAGLLPSMKAAKLDPIEALRTE